MIFRNDAPVFLWGFALVFLVFVALMTYVLVRDGTPAGYSPLLVHGVMGIFWIAGLGLGHWVWGMRRLRVEIEPGGSLLITWWSPIRKTTRRVAASEVTVCEVAEESDSEGDPYFYSRVRLRDGVTLDIKESHSREVCERAVRRFNEVRPRGPRPAGPVR